VYCLKNAGGASVQCFSFRCDMNLLINSINQLKLTFKQTHNMERYTFSNYSASKNAS
jgi:hypothetical protein